MGRGGKREGAGRKKVHPVEMDRITVRVPSEVKEEIREKVKKLTEAYIEKCKTEQ